MQTAYHCHSKRKRHSRRPEVHPPLSESECDSERIALRALSDWLPKIGQGVRAIMFARKEAADDFVASLAGPVFRWVHEGRFAVASIELVEYKVPEQLWSEYNLEWIVISDKLEN